MCDKCKPAMEVVEQIRVEMDLQDAATKPDSAERVRNYYRRQGAKSEQKRIIDLLLDLNVIRRAEAGRLVAFDTNGEKVVYLTGLEEPNA